jgi:hypothetical protein
VPSKHIVEAGECAVTIAWRHGFGDYKKVWKFGSNSALADKGRTPYTLTPGDELEVPDREAKSVQLGTGSRHSIVVKLPAVALRLKLLGVQGEAWAGEEFTLEAAGLPKPIKGTTGPDGALEAKLPVAAKQATLAIRGETFTLELSHLNAIPHDQDDPLAGAADRLRNLGYHVGEGDAGSLAVRWALALFQTDHDLEVTGELDDATKGKLVEAHGV